MTTGIDSSPQETPMVQVSAPWHMSESNFSTVAEPEQEENMVEQVGESGDSNSHPQPHDGQPTAGDGRTLRKRPASEESGGNPFYGPDGAVKAASEFFRRQGFHGSYSLRQWAMECSIPRGTLRYQCDKLSAEEQDNLRELGRLEAENQSKTDSAEKRRSIWSAKAEAKQQVGQQALYLSSGVTFEEYREAHAWGVKQIVAGKMTPLVASQAILQRFEAMIKPDTLRKAAYLYKSEKDVVSVARVGAEPILPREIEEGLVEVVEFMQSCSPPFPVFKSFLMERCEFLIQSAIARLWYPG